MRVITAPLAKTRLLVLGGAFTEASFFLLISLGGVMHYGPFLTVLPVAIALVYGWERSTSLHPAMSAAYLAWLRTTPWKPGRPLPNGPVYPVVQDIPVIAGIVALALIYQKPPDHEMYLITYWPVVLELLAAGYLAGLVPILLLAGPRHFGYTLIFLLLCCGLTRFQSVTTVPVILSGLVIGCIGLYYNLRKFPWDRPDGTALPDIRNPGTDASRETQAAVGWPFSALAPVKAKALVNVTDALWITLLTGWFSFVVFTLLPPESSMICYGALYVFVVPLLRLAVYIDGCATPITLLGRLFTFRLIIPRYDVALLAPATASACAVLGMWVALQNSTSPDIQQFALAAGSAASVASCLLIGPGLATWKQAGAYRMVKSVFVNKKQELVQ